jgi:hypothetical protein
MCDRPSLERANEIMDALTRITRINAELGTAFRIIHHTVKSTGSTASGQDLLGGPVLRAWARSSLLFGERAAKGMTTISYEEQRRASGPVCRMRTLATDAAPGVRSLFNGLRVGAARRRRSTKDVATTPTKAGALPETNQKVLDALPCMPGDLVTGGMPKGSAYRVRSARPAWAREKGDGGVWTHHHQPEREAIMKRKYPNTEARLQARAADARARRALAAERRAKAPTVVADAVAGDPNRSTSRPVTSLDSSARSRSCSLACSTAARRRPRRASRTWSRTSRRPARHGRRRSRGRGGSG